MNTKLLAVAVSAAVISFSANAAVEGTWSVGAAAGWNHAFDDFDDFYSYDPYLNGIAAFKPEVTDSNGYGFKLNGEYNFTDWFGLGLGYDYLGGTKMGVGAFGATTADSSFHTNVVELYGRFALPLDTNGSDVFFKVGPTWNRTSMDGDSDSNIGAILGVGGQYALTKDFSVRAGYDYLFKTAKSDEVGDLNNGLLYVGFQYNFGGNTPVAPAPKPVAVQKKTVRVTENHNLAAGLLFPFDGSSLSAEGKKAINDVVASSKKLDNTEFEVYGYTDRIGSDAYNQKLSQKRADAVTAELQSEGVTTVKVSEGRGKSSPVTGNKCDSVKGRQAVIDCLAADRRVEIVVTGDTVREEQQ
ncbi:MAG: outer membrane beta-barrel protein [Succinivibrio sp.]